MSIFSIIKNSVATRWMGQGFSGLKKVGFAGLGGAVGYYSYGHEYGSGTAFIYAAASWSPITSIPLLLLESGKQLGDWSYQQQQSRRKSSFGKSRISDPFDTIKQMRIQSIQQLSRDHSSKQRMINNEAQRFHRR